MASRGHADVRVVLDHLAAEVSRNGHEGLLAGLALREFGHLSRKAEFVPPHVNQLVISGFLDTYPTFRQESTAEDFTVSLQSGSLTR
jgi:hypothetical protein